MSSLLHCAYCQKFRNREGIKLQYREKGLKDWNSLKFGWFNPEFLLENLDKYDFIQIRYKHYIQ